MAGKTSEGSIKWQLCYDISARTWWMPPLGLISAAASRGRAGAPAAAPGHIKQLVVVSEASRPLTPS
ncbi:nuclear factor 1 A-type, partial [Lates japonicus]